MVHAGHHKQAGKVLCHGNATLFFAERFVEVDRMLGWDHGVRPTLPYEELAACLLEGVHVAKFDFPGDRVVSSGIGDGGRVRKSRRVLVKVVIGYVIRWADRWVEGHVLEITLSKWQRLPPARAGDPCRPK